jgi:hypothetical protein
MLALHKILNLVGGWAYKNKHNLDKDSEVITSTSKSGRSSRSTNYSKTASSNTLTPFKIGYKKGRGTKKGKSKVTGKGTRTRNKTRSKRY